MQEILDILNKFVLNDNVYKMCSLEEISDKDIIDFILLQLIYLQNTNQIDLQTVKQILKKTSDLNQQFSLETLFTRIKWLKKLGLNEIDMGLEKSHEIILSSFDTLNQMLNDNYIDYYHISGLIIYLLSIGRLERHHHDLDIFLNEEDLELLENCCLKNNITFCSYIYKRNQDTDRLVTKLKLHVDNITVSVSVFLFSRENDGSLIEKDYFYDKNGNLFVNEIYNSPQCTELSFPEKVNFHNNVPFRSLSLEALYNCKTGTRPKDIYDRQIMSSFVNEEQAQLILSLMSTEADTREIPSCDVEKLKVKRYVRGNYATSKR